MKSRTEVLTELVNMTRPVEDVRSELNEFEWNSQNELYTLTRTRIISVFERALRKEFPLEDLVSWADGMEMREDLAYEEGHEDEIAHLLFTLSTPEINYPITEELIEKLLNDLGNLGRVKHLT